MFCFKNYIKMTIRTALAFSLFFVVLNGVFASDTATRRFGIFIGSNNGGRDRVMLRYAVNDAKSVSRVFNVMGGIAAEDSVLLVEPTIAEINRQLDTMVRTSAQARRNSQRTELVFFYSGHSDENGLFLNREHYNYRDLRDRINTVETDMKIVILDSCSSGAITRAKGGVKTQPFLFDSSISATGYAFLTSSSDDEASQESDSIESSYFTHSILAGLRGAADSVGDGRVTLNELYRYAYTETLAKTETSLYGPQHPSYDIQISGSGDVVLTDIKETSAILIVSEEVTGRISIRDRSDFLIAELTKVAHKPLMLGLEPGFYRITLQQGNNFYRSEVQLPENRQTNLRMTNFSMIAGTPGGVRRGDYPAEDNLEASDNSSKPRASLYTFFVNIIDESFRFPLFGMINIAKGNFFLPQFGFINVNTGNLSSMQAGFVNYTQGNFLGVQAGFVNTVFGGLTGVQSGFVNAAGSFRGGQLGFVNAVLKESIGLQAGFVNVSAQKLKGVQLGFVNYADSIEDGIPIGFISIVRNGGYRALEYSFSEFFPVNLGIKLGVEKFYTTISVAYGSVDEKSWDHFASGFGVGSIFNISRGFFFNPEINHNFHSRSSVNQFLTSVIPAFGFKVGNHFSISAGPAVTWVHAYRDSVPRKSLFHIYEYNFDDKNDLVIGLRASMRLIF